MEHTHSPFVLLLDGKVKGGLLYTDPVRIIEAHDGEQVAPCLEEIDTARKNGLYAAGWISYESGLTLEPRLVPLLETSRNGDPLLWFGLFKPPKQLTGQEVDRALKALETPDTSPVSKSGWPDLAPSISFQDYQKRFDRIQAFIASGHVYQINLTFDMQGTYNGCPVRLFRQLCLSQPTTCSALIHDGVSWHLSLSPEIFFDLEQRVVRMRPMKGTTARCLDPDEDLQRRIELQKDPKQRAENLMIVDLLRNDTSRIATVGSVVVRDLFTVESHPTVHQMTSGIEATRSDQTRAVDVLRALFPCGSITGAPKIKAMEIIHELEQRPRGIYTGAIGHFLPNGDAQMNVAIRTLTLRPADKGNMRACLGVGSGIVTDSEVSDEWKECLTKADFTAPFPDFDLIETFRWQRDRGYIRLDRHIDRLASSAQDLGFICNIQDIRHSLDRLRQYFSATMRIRLLLSKCGRFSLHATPFVPDDKPMLVTFAALPPRPLGPGPTYKTSLRQAYDRARAKAQTDEVVFIDPLGYAVEGSFSNLFIRKGEILLTPGLWSGPLPGIYRQELIDEGRAIEADITDTDILNAEGFFIGNSLRGLRKAILHPPSTNNT